MEPAFYTPSQLARRWQVAPSTISRMIRDGRLHAIHLGDRLHRIPAEEVHRIESNQ